MRHRPFYTRRQAFSIAFGLSLLVAPYVSYGQPSLLKPPSQEIIAEARELVKSMRDNPRGPYESIRWFCKDGTILPPKPYACSDRGGGKQHAAFSEQRKKLAQLGWRVGTIYAAFDELPEQNTAEVRNHLRLRELPLERYLIDIDDGWVLRQARSYRGRVQLEDEQAAGREILLDVLEENGWKKNDFLLVKELIRVIPHNNDSEDMTRTIRRQSQLLAEMDRSFEPLRAEIHGQPTRSTSTRVRQWIKNHKTLTRDVEKIAVDLAAELEVLYSVEGSTQRLVNLSKSLNKKNQDVSDAILSAAKEKDNEQRLAFLAEAVSALRKSLDGATNAILNLKYLDLLTELETEILAVSRMTATPESRLDVLRRIVLLLRATHALGWLSTGEYLSLSEPVLEVKQLKKGPSGEQYRQLIRRLQMAPAWAQASIKHTFAEPLAAYQALDVRASQFIDDLLRSSPLLPLADMTQLLLIDSGRLSGKTSSVFDEPQKNVWGLNPGVARGRLRVFSDRRDFDGHQFNKDEIVVIPSTTTSLFPAAGIISIGEGNPLSHIQILARNLGIPNVVIDESLLATLQKNDGTMVELAAAADGRVLIRHVSEAAVAEKATPASSVAEKVLAPVPDLNITRPLLLSELNKDLSGRVVGPKAANVGELARIFPDRIAPAVALPFGAFAKHTESGTNAPRMRVKRAFSQLNNNEIDEDAFLNKLDKAREDVAAIQLHPETRKLLESAMKREFGGIDGYGVFVRSDTNMEDLPQFTGAGLNETIPNVFGLEKQFAAISRVWASVYSRRAMAWRSQILKNPDDVFSSVLLMKSVPSDKSGVIVTTDLFNSGGKGLTVSLSWGVGGAVDNESAASYLLKPNGDNILLSEAKAPYQRYLKPGGGVGWRPALAGGVLDKEETEALRELAKEVIDKYPPTFDADGKPLPWDIEFAFAEGKLMLLQIRPLVQRGAQSAEKVVSSVIPKPSRDHVVLLDEKLKE